jgi:hypothetical protein
MTSLSATGPAFAGVPANNRMLSIAAMVLKARFLIGGDSFLVFSQSLL